MRKYTYRLVFWLGLVCGLYSCEETTDLDLVDNVPVLVVDGLITDAEPPYFIKLSTTTNFNDEKNGMAVDNALIRLADNTGNEETLMLVENGVYKNKDIIGMPGRTYFLEIEWNGQTYTGSAFLDKVGDIDSLTYRYEDESLLFDEGYFLSYFGKKSDPTSISYYRWIISKNNEPLNTRFDLLVSSDEFINGLSGLEFDVAFKLNDTVKVAVYSLSKPVFDYYNGLIALVNNDGGLFSTTPENPRSNITNGALGIFQASSVKSDSVIIK